MHASAHYTYMFVTATTPYNILEHEDCELEYVKPSLVRLDLPRDDRAQNLYQTTLTLHHRML